MKARPGTLPPALPDDGDAGLAAALMAELGDEPAPDAIRFDGKGNRLPSGNATVTRHVGGEDR